MDNTRQTSARLLILASDMRWTVSSSQAYLYPVTQAPAGKNPTELMADQAYVLHEHECRIGRDETCHIRIADNGRISREHAIIRREGQGYAFYDHSLNGSAINGKRVHQSRQLLHHGDIIGLADLSVLFSFCDPAEEAVELPSVAEPLTSRELEVLRLVAAGLTNQAIADRLYISSNTVKFHLRAVYGKLGVADRLQAINRARALGLL